MKNNKSFNKKDYFYSKINHKHFPSLSDDFNPLLPSTISNNGINLKNTHIYPTFRNSKNNLLFNQPKKIMHTLTSSNSVSSFNIYSKNKIKKLNNRNNNNYNTNNIIINNTNIINNNQTNIINNNIINDNKNYKNSISQLNMKQIKELTKNNQNNGNIQIINNNVMRQKPLITRRKVMKKNKKTIKDNNNFNGIFNISYNRNNNSNFSERKHQSGFETDFNFNKNNEEKNTIFNIEEILMMEEKLSSLINCLRDCNPCSEECFEFLNFYFTTKLSKNLNTYFTNKNYLIIIKRTINLE